MSEAAKKTRAKTGEKCPRPYRLGQRETAMEETRARVLAAAREIILGENALAGFSIDAVAKQAGVTRVTVYQRFGSKRGVLEALFDEIGARGRLGEKIPQVFALSDPLEAMRAYIQVFCEFWDMDRVMARRLRGFAALDEEFAAAIASRYERRQFALRRLLVGLNERLSGPALAAQDETIQTLLALTGFEFYDVLAGATRTPDEMTEIIFGLVVRDLGIWESV